MNNCLVRNKKISIVCAGEVIELIILPLTFMRLIDINTALGEGKDLSTVMDAPAPLDLSIVTYCLLDGDSKKIIENAKLEIDGESEETNSAHKLFYLMCENNVADGLNNYSNVLNAIIEQLKDSTNKEETKKKNSGQSVSLCLEEVYDKIGSNYPYTYTQFLEQFTPKLADKLIEIINIRENNQYCYNAMMHGHNMKKHIIKPKVAVYRPKNITEEEYREIDEGIRRRIKETANVKR